jgi:hypothetical protein
VQVGAADCAGSKPDNRVGGILNLRLGDVVDANVANTMKYNCLHETSVRKSETTSAPWTELLEQLTGKGKPAGFGARVLILGPSLESSEIHSTQGFELAGRLRQRTPERQLAQNSQAERLHCFELVEAAIG